MLLGFGEPALQSDDQREVLPHSWIDRIMGFGPGQRRFGVRQVPRQGVRQTEIGQHRRLVGDDLERGPVVALRFVCAAHLVEHGALRGENAPIGLIRASGRGRAPSSACS